MKRYRYNPETNEMEDDDGRPMLTEEERNRPPPRVQIIKDLEPHMVGSTYVGSRAAQRELAKTQDLVPFERVSKYARAMPTSIYDPRDDKWQQYMKDTKEKVAASSGLEVKEAEEIAAKKSNGSLREKIKLKQAGKVDTTPRTTIHGEVSNPIVKTVAAHKEERIKIRPEIRERVAARLSK